MTQFTIRRADNADIPLLVRMRADFLAEVSSADAHAPALLEALTSYFTSAVPAGEFVALLAEAEGRVVAVAGMVLQRIAPSAKNLSGREGYIMNVYTLPPWRGTGIAADLLRKLVELARQSKCRRVRLHAVEKAVGLYAREGFQTVGNEMEIDFWQKPE